MKRIYKRASSSVYNTAVYPFRNPLRAKLDREVYFSVLPLAWNPFAYLSAGRMFSAVKGQEETERYAQS